MKPLVLVHGFMGGSAQWADQFEEFGDRFNVITVDLPGFGANSGQIAPDTIGGFADYVLGELDRKGIQSFYLLGHSMGGMIVQEMVAKAPHRIQQLVLYGTASTGNLPGRFETFDVSKQRAQDDGVQLTARRISATWFLELEQAKGFESCATIAEQSSQQALQAALDAMKIWSRTENLPNIDCPTLIIWGENDRTYAWQQVHQLWDQISNSSLAVMPRCSHAAHLENPKLFNLLLADFLN